MSFYIVGTEAHATIFVFMVGISRSRQSVIPKVHMTPLRQLNFSKVIVTSYTGLSPVTVNTSTAAEPPRGRTLLITFSEDAPQLATAA